MQAVLKICKISKNYEEDFRLAAPQQVKTFFVYKYENMLIILIIQLQVF